MAEWQGVKYLALLPVPQAFGMGIQPVWLYSKSASKLGFTNSPTVTCIVIPFADPGVRTTR
jgi:hypothetical protein